MTLEEFQRQNQFLTKAVKIAYQGYPEVIDYALGVIPEEVNYFKDRTIQDYTAECIKYISKFTGEMYEPYRTRDEIHDALDLVLSIEHLREIILEHYGIPYETLAIDEFEFGYYIPSRKLVIEVTKLKESTSNLLAIDYFKRMNKVLAERGIKLLRFTDEELYTKTDLVCSMIEHNLQVTRTKIPARKCTVAKIPNKQATEFENKNHLNGAVNALESYALIHEGEIVQVITFSKHRYANRTGKVREETWEVIRACTKKFCLVQGGTQKLFKAFRTNHPDVVLHTYCDMNISDGNSYQLKGKLISETDGDLWYVIPDKYSVTECTKVIRNRMMKIYLHKYFEGFPKRDDPDYKKINSVEFLRNQGIYEYRGAGNLVYEIE